MPGSGSAISSSNRSIQAPAGPSRTSSSWATTHRSPWLPASTGPHGPTRCLPRRPTSGSVRATCRPAWRAFPTARCAFRRRCSPVRASTCFATRSPRSRFSVPMEGPTGSMELLIREPAGEIAVAGLANVPEVKMEGVRYRRFAGRDMAPSVVTVARGGHRGGVWVRYPSPRSFSPSHWRERGPSWRRGHKPRRIGAVRPGERGRQVLVAIARLDEQRGAGGLAAGGL